MSGSESNDGNVTKGSILNDEWLDYHRKVLEGFGIIEIILLSIALWILTSAIAYGTKTGRWRNTAQTSSLNNGLIFIAGVITLFGYIPRLSATIVMYKLPRLEEDWCEFVFDFSSGSFTVAIWGSYAFLWTRQRMIYNHPYVKPHVARWINWLSVSMVLLLTVNALGVGFTQIQRDSYNAGPVGCVYQVQNENPGKADRNATQISLLVFLLLLQSVIAALFVYPAKKVLFQQIQNETDSPDTNVLSHSEMLRRSTWLTMFICCGNSNAPTSPVQMSVRRTISCSFVMLIADVITTAIDIPLDLSTIPAVSKTIYDIGLIIHAFCIVMTFGFASSAFTLFWPKCQIRTKSKTLLQMVGEANPVYKADDGSQEKQFSNA